jgi:hypothetical protein
MPLIWCGCRGTKRQVAAKLPFVNFRDTRRVATRDPPPGTRIQLADAPSRSYPVRSPLVIALHSFRPFIPNYYATIVQYKVNTAGKYTVIPT